MVGMECELLQRDSQARMGEGMVLGSRWSCGEEKGRNCVPVEKK